jgi:hypothetical protein
LLRFGQSLKPVQQRRAQLVQPGEGQLHLRLHTGCTRDAAPCHLGDKVIQQGGFADARLTAYHQRCTVAGTNSFDQVVKRLAFIAPVLQHQQAPPAASPA